MQRVEHIGDCDKCPSKNVRIDYGWTTRAGKHCTKCNRDRLVAAQKAKDKAKPRQRVIVQQRHVLRSSLISKKPSPRLAAMRDEDWVVGLEIWAERPHHCLECEIFLPEDSDNLPYKIYFSHILSKGAHPELRFDPENIVLHCPDCHRFWETSGKMKTMRTYALKFSYMQKHGFVEKAD